MFHPACSRATFCRGAHRRLKESISHRTKAAKSAKTRNSVDKHPPSVANPFNLIKHKGLIGVAAAKTDQYPRACHQSLPVPRGRLKAGQTRRRPQGMCFPCQGLQRSMARFQATTRRAGPDSAQGCVARSLFGIPNYTPRALPCALSGSGAVLVMIDDTPYLSPADAKTKRAAPKV